MTTYHPKTTEQRLVLAERATAMVAFLHNLSNKSADADGTDLFGPLAVEFAGLLSLLAALTEASLYGDDNRVGKASRRLKSYAAHLSVLRSLSVVDLHINAAAIKKLRRMSPAFRRNPKYSMPLGRMHS